jgi:hypothetical protein
MNYSPNHPAVRAWQDNRRCDQCWGTDLPVVRKYNMCTECEPLTIRERKNLVNLRAGRQMMRSGLKSRALVGLGLFIAGCYALDITYLGGLVLYGLCFICWQTGLNRWFKEQGL